MPRRPLDLSVGMRLQQSSSQQKHQRTWRCIQPLSRPRTTHLSTSWISMKGLRLSNAHSCSDHFSWRQPASTEDAEQCRAMRRLRSAAEVVERPVLLASSCCQRQRQIREAPWHCGWQFALCEVQDEDYLAAGIRGCSRRARVGRRSGAVAEQETSSETVRTDARVSLLALFAS